MCRKAQEGGKETATRDVLLLGCLDCASALQERERSPPGNPKRRASEENGLSLNLWRRLVLLTVQYPRCGLKLPRRRSGVRQVSRQKCYRSMSFARRFQGMSVYTQPHRAHVAAQSRSTRAALLHNHIYSQILTCVWIAGGCRGYSLGKSAVSVSFSCCLFVPAEEG